MAGQIRVPDGGADLQSAIGRRLDRGEGQPADVDEPRRRFDVQLHQVEQGCSAGNKPHVRALLSGFRLRGNVDRGRGVCRPNEFKDMHEIAPARV